MSSLPGRHLVEALFVQTKDSFKVVIRKVVLRKKKKTSQCLLRPGKLNLGTSNLKLHNVNRKSMRAVAKELLKLLQGVIGTDICCRGLNGLASTSMAQITWLLVGVVQVIYIYILETQFFDELILIDCKCYLFIMILDFFQGRFYQDCRLLCWPSS